MKNIHNAEELKTAILELENKKTAEELALKDQFQKTYETYKPANILKNTLEEVSESPKFRKNLFNVVLGLGVGLLSKKLVVGKSAGLVKKVLGTALQYGMTSIVANKAHVVEDKILDSKSKPGKKPSLLKRILSI
jgi:hypothetical protein